VRDRHRPEYLDVSVPARTSTATRHGAGIPSSYVIEAQTSQGRDPFAYEITGSNYFDMGREPFVANRDVVLFDDGDRIEVTTEEEPVRFLLISGRPIGEPVAWYGPIVMNTQEELRTAFEEYRAGTFVKNAGGELPTPPRRSAPHRP
jgi:redox-sensitive bicupin YhaK (pirin superfamily)